MYSGLFGLSDVTALALRTAVYPNITRNLNYPILGLCGEAGELANKWKKVIRDEDGVMSAGTRDKIIDELGDVLWYVGCIANELDVTLDDVYVRNECKLLSRQREGTLRGAGDAR
jgi:NTP pyrophosphatase (non-canonical NTP hydrolase)